MHPNKESKLKKRLRKNELTEKQKKALKVLFLVLAIVVFIIGIVFIFNKAKVLRVEMTGLQTISAIDVIKTSGISKYNNYSLIFLPYKDIKESIEKNPLLKVTGMKPSFPDLLVINVEERGTLFLLEHKGRIYEITDDGYIIFKSAINNYDVPYLTGFNIDTNNITVEDEYTKYILNTLKELKDKDFNVYNSISEINAFGKDLIVYPRAYPVKVILEKYVKADKFIELAAILKTMQNQNKYVSEIDFRFKEAIIR